MAELIGNWEYDPKTKVAQRIAIDDRGQAHIEKSQEVGEIIDAVQRQGKHGPVGNKDLQYMGSLPLTEVAAHQHKGVQMMGQEADDKYIADLFKDAEYSKLRGRGKS